MTQITVSKVKNGKCSVFNYGTIIFDIKKKGSKWEIWLDGDVISTLPSLKKAKEFAERLMIDDENDDSALGKFY